MKKLLALSLIFFTYSFVWGQKLSFSGTVKDTTLNQPLPFAVVIAVKIKDSTLVKYTRTNEKGFFQINKMPIDTYRVVISHKKFNDKTFYVIGTEKNYEFDFKNIVLPPKSTLLDEVTIFAFKDPVYYKGDTLIYTADSFKVKPNASVEDLLRRLPGIKVDAAGKITAQGKEVNKVLVDGDEFFGTDPTMATKNLAANAVESVQVYEKKDENASADNSAEETIKVMNLKLKDDAKKGYFGKATAASDFQNFYEGELLANRFRNKQKISVFALTSNTPKTGFGWGDMDKFGLNNEESYSWDEDNMTFNGPDRGQGIPTTLNSGIYYNDKLNKRTKINANYSFKNNSLLTENEEKSQYFLPDTTYTTNNKSTSQTNAQLHNLNLNLDFEIDSVTKIFLIQKTVFNVSKYSSTTKNNFVTITDFVTRETENINTNESEGLDSKSNLHLERKFKKKDRSLNIFYTYEVNNNKSSGNLITKNTFYTSALTPINDFDQRKENTSFTDLHKVAINFYEPITKKIKTDMGYEYTYTTSNQNKISLNKFNNEYSVLDSVYSNDFINYKSIHQARMRFIYEIKKYSISIGVKARNVNLDNVNYFNGSKFNQNVNNLLPFARFNYNFNQNTRFNLTYNSNSQLPSINQLQPLPNNANQNFITLGNPNLKPTFSNNLMLNFNTYKPISGKYMWLGGRFNQVQNAFSSNLVYDSLGRSISTPINVDGNYSGNTWLGGSLPFFQRMLSINAGCNTNFYSNYNYINNQKNITRNTGIGGNLGFEVNLEKLVFDVSGNYDYNIPYSSIGNQNSEPYTTQNYRFNGRVELPKKVFIESDANYNLNSRRAEGYNINFLIINASVTKIFGKLDNIILAAKVYDILNQNIVANRQVYNNIITDSKTNIISRYFLLSFTYKFNSQKTKENNENED